MNKLPVTEIFNIAKRDNWVVEYNANLDYLYWSKPRISPTARLQKFLDDFSLYITPDGIIEGIFIEYAKGGFMSHNAEYQALLDNMTKVDDEKYILTDDKMQKSQPLLKGIASMVGNETLAAVLNKKIDLESIAMVHS